MFQIVYNFVLACSAVVTVVALAFAIAIMGVWPFPVAQQINLSVFQGEPGVEIGLLQKLENDFGGRPWRKLVYRHHKSNPDLEPVSFPGLAPGAVPPRMYISPDAPRGYRIVIGAFNLKDGFDAALLIDTDGAVRHWWPLREDEAVGGEGVRNTFVHGFVVNPDGSVIFAMDLGNSISRIDACGHPMWIRSGKYSHAINRADDGSIWALREYSLMHLDSRTGETLQELHLATIMEQNPDIDIFALRQADRLGESEWTADFWHPNEVEPLPADLADRFPDFEAGDLLVSLRSINLVFVASPKTAKVKWWRMGAWRRQHDPDWGDDGRILVYDNRMHRNFSRIVSVDPKTFEQQTLVDGADYDFHSAIRGKVQRHSGGALLVTASQQGRVFEVDASGRVTFEFESNFSEEANFAVSEAMFIPENYFEFDRFPQCPR
jgi:hypothetical protein